MLINGKSKIFKRPFFCIICIKQQVTRFKEHRAHLRFRRFEKSSVAQHIFESDHHIDDTCLRLVRSVNNCKFLNIFESIEIFKNRDRVLNADGGPIPSTSLYTLLPKVGVDISSSISHVNSQFFVVLMMPTLLAKRVDNLVNFLVKRGFFQFLL